MKNKLLSIGQMAKMNHTTVPTLRLYDQLGLLHPRYTDPETSYRYYDIRQNARFDLIQYMKELGMGNDRYVLIDMDHGEKRIDAREAVAGVKPFGK